jgi:hypothetical protein
MEKNTVYENLVEHFGELLAARVYACAVIMRDNSEKLEGENDETAVRFTIGALKRRRIQGGRRVLTWIEAVEKLELEQDEGRHYGLVHHVDKDIKRIEHINKYGYEDATGAHVATGEEARKENAARAAGKLAMALQAEHDRYNADPVDNIMVRAWFADYLANMTKTRMAFIGRVLADIRAGKDIARTDMQNISMRKYAPEGVKPAEFVELLRRYAA